MAQPAENIKVAVRCRPLSNREKENGDKKVVEVDENRGEVHIKNPKENSKPKTFAYDFAYSDTSIQKSVYDECASKIVTACINGYNGTIFAYGQTGTGKTWTMEGDKHKENEKGIIPRSFDHIFKHINGTPDTQFLVTASMLEIYNEQVRDLLQNQDAKLDIKQDGKTAAYVKGLSATEVLNQKECFNLLVHGSSSRHVAATSMNDTSSRSHSIFTLVIETCIEVDGAPSVKRGKLNLVDLAGSEKSKKTGATGATFKEGIGINLSLSCLGNVISCLVDGNKNSVPAYRESKLTRLLQDSLGGNAKTIMIAAIGPADYNYDETLGTLRYASRAKSIKNAPKINQNPKDAKLTAMKDEIEALRKALQDAMGGDFDMSKMGGFGGLGADGDKHDAFENAEDGLRKEADELEAQMERQREKIMANKELDQRKKDELMNRIGEKKKEEDLTRKKKQKMIDDLKEKEQKIMIGQKKNEEELKKYNDDLLRIEKERQTRLETQKQMQKEIGEAILASEEIHGKINTDKENVKTKAKGLGKVKSLLEKKRDDHEEMVEAYNMEEQDITDELKNLRKMISLNEIIMEFIPDVYQSFLKFKMNTDVYSVPHKSVTGNKLMETNFDKRKDLLAAWREGDDRTIVYSADDEIEQSFFKVNPGNMYSKIKMVGKPVD